MKVLIDVVSITEFLFYLTLKLAMTPFRQLQEAGLGVRERSGHCGDH